ncbi:HAMP domain-containing histidine kinase [Planosporangium thailandense]|uniref:histidine kinase n=1 Tax=Planosporangium thailandense TaxID=765197 RepID=A0ABX0XU44_9ACTN|nr:HAMP domain-containing sensor histidine kinase [Planosporangium thailandense]NJC68950.1 HAMP domain-containing histidine kinase [Planosporangium thailandense]
MAAPAQPLDPVALLDRLTDLIELIGQGESGLRGLQLIVDAAAAVTGACGAGFVEYTRSGGHLVAATSSLTWALGLPVEIPEHAVTTMIEAPHCRQALVGDLPPEFAARIRGRGIQRIISTVGSAGGSLVGSLHVCFPDADGRAEPYHLAALRLLAAAAARLYRESAELPVYPDGPTASPDGQQEREQGRDLFIAMTSHELRTPVTAIKGYADTLVERWDSLDEAARRDAAGVVRQRARELARLIDRLLAAASGVTGVSDGSTGAPFDPAQVLRDAVAELNPELRRVLRVNLPAELPKVRGDRASFSTVLTELATNACKYSPDWVDVELTAGADAYTVWIRVADRGLGIRPEHAERAFDRFWQLDRGDKRQYGGVGLGLYLVRKIVERQNGWVSLRPREGGGAVAEVRLPRATAAAG